MILGIFMYKVIQQWPDQFFHLIVCNVGQGDAILLKYGFFQVLVDAGPDESVLSCLEKQMPAFDQTIELLILTHFDDDHIGGAPAVLKFYQIFNLYLSLTDYKDSAVFLELKEHLLAEMNAGASLKEPFLGQQIAFVFTSAVYQAKNPDIQAKYNSMPSVLLTFLTPMSLSKDEIYYLRGNDFFLAKRPEADLSKQLSSNFKLLESNNDRSIVTYLQFDRLRIILNGDLESTGEKALLEQGLIKDVDILKVGHHGSKSSTTPSFLSQLRPETSLISCGENNQFKHPNQEVLERLSNFSSQILRTDQLGELEIVSNGREYWIKEQ